MPETIERRSGRSLLRTLARDIIAPEADMLGRGAAASADQVDPSVFDEALDFPARATSGVSL